MTTATPDKRRGERISLSLSAVVRAKENKDSYWKETTDLISISRSGAGFYLDRKCEVGRLVSLIMPMPRHLRSYDRDRELYRVWGLVQHCSPVSGTGTGGFHVGVAFVGRHVPSSYHENPLQSYRIAGMNEDGTWRIVESKSDFVVRKYPRYWVSLKFSLSALDDDKNLIADEMAATENISASGAAVFSDLAVDLGDSVNIDCPEYDFSSIAIVRNRQRPDIGPAKLHLEFINETFPIEQVDLRTEEDFPEDAEPAENAEETTAEIEETVSV